MAPEERNGGDHCPEDGDSGRVFHDGYQCTWACDMPSMVYRMAVQASSLGWSTATISRSIAMLPDSIAATVVSMTLRSHTGGPAHPRFTTMRLSSLQRVQLFWGTDVNVEARSYDVTLTTPTTQAIELARFAASLVPLLSTRELETRHEGDDGPASRPPNSSAETISQSWRVACFAVARWTDGRMICASRLEAHLLRFRRWFPTCGSIRARGAPNSACSSSRRHSLKSLLPSEHSNTSLLAASGLCPPTDGFLHLEALGLKDSEYGFDEFRSIFADVTASRHREPSVS